MNNLEVTIDYVENAAVSINLPDKRIWIDINPEVLTPDFSCVRPEDWDIVKTDKKYAPTEVIFTHCHPDHYSEKRTHEISEIYPDVKIFLPAGPCTSGGFLKEINPEGQKAEYLTGAEYTYKDGELELYFFKTLHSYKVFETVPHYSLFIKYAGKCIFVSGDAKITDDVLINKLESTDIDLAIVNFPWVTMEKTRTVLRESVNPKHALLVHIPSADYNHSHYREITENGASHVDFCSVKLAMEPMKTFKFSL